MANNQPASAGSSAAALAPQTQEYVVRVPKAANKKYSVMKFNPANNVDFTRCDDAKLARENNVKQFKLSHDIDVMPKFGAGSEFGREQKEEARRKKFGMALRKYQPENQPWLLNLTHGKANPPRRFKGVREGGVLENASYYIFTQCADGAFDAFPVEDWYNFTPIIRYKYLNSEEAEEEFQRRDKTLNYFSVMLKNRLKNDGAMDVDDPDEDGEKKKKSKKKKGKDFLLTDMDEWANLSNDEDDDESNDEGGPKDSDDEVKKKKDKKTAKKAKKVKKSKESDAEASEDSDDIDEGQEVDYITSSDSDDQDMYQDAAKIKTDKYQEGGVEDEDGLRKIIDSGDEDEDENEDKKKEEEEEEEEETDRPKKEKDGSESESSDSDSDSDPEKDTSIASALFMQKKGITKVESRRDSASSENPSAPHSRSGTPTVPGDDKKGTKRKTDGRDSPSVKKSRSSTPQPPAPTDKLEDAVRRYLKRKPITTADLLSKLHKSTGTSKDQLVKAIPQILKRINPEKIKAQGKLYLHIKKTE